MCYIHSCIVYSKKLLPVSYTHLLNVGGCRVARNRYCAEAVDRGLNEYVRDIEDLSLIHIFETMTIYRVSQRLCAQTLNGSIIGYLLCVYVLGFEVRQCAFCRAFVLGKPVSYTHLDVYKRQVFRPVFAVFAVQNGSRIHA